MTREYDIAVIGGGPAGLAAAESAYNNGARRIVIIERDVELGGILNQCIHNGFGLHHFHEELTGPEYAGRFIDLVGQTDIDVMLESMVLHIGDHTVAVLSKRDGYVTIRAGAIILAMGCRERTRGAIGIPGTRPAGVFSAGTAQRYINIEGCMVGRRVVILGSGDIGLIMARRLTLEGAQVLACVELMPYSNGLTRNIVQCLDDYGIPLYLSHTITDIRGDRRVTGVTVERVDDCLCPIPGSGFTLDCDTVLLSVGLIPENELSREAGIAIDPRTRGPIVSETMQTSDSSIFAAGNVLHVHDLVDFVTEESTRAGLYAARYTQDVAFAGGDGDALQAGDNVAYTVPQRLRDGNVEKALPVLFRVRCPIPKGRIVITRGGTQIAAFNREHMAPAEMERISLPKVLLDRAQGDITISVEVQEEPQ